MYNLLLQHVKISEWVRPVLYPNFAKNWQNFYGPLQVFWGTTRIKSDVFRHETLKQIYQNIERFTTIASNRPRINSVLNKQNSWWWNAARSELKKTSCMCRVPINECKLRHHDLLYISKNLKIFKIWSRIIFKCFELLCRYKKEKLFLAQSGATFYC